MLEICLTSESSSACPTAAVSPFPSPASLAATCQSTSRTPAGPTAAASISYRNIVCRLCLPHLASSLTQSPSLPLPRCGAAPRCFRGGAGGPPSRSLGSGVIHGRSSSTVFHTGDTTTGRCRTTVMPRGCRCICVWGLACLVTATRRRPTRRNGKMCFPGHPVDVRVGRAGPVPLQVGVDGVLLLVQLVAWPPASCCSARARGAEGEWVALSSLAWSGKRMQRWC